MGNKESPAVNPERSKEQQISATARSDDNRAVTTASPLPKTAPSNTSANSKPRKGTGKKIIYTLNVTLSCTEDRSKKERELGFTWVPEMIADLQEEIQDQFNIPVFDQKLTFGPTALSSKESIQSYSLRDGDGITVEYTSEADVQEIVGVVSSIQKNLTFVDSVQHQLFLFPIPLVLKAQLQQNSDIVLAVCDNYRNLLYVSSTPAKRIMNSQFFVVSGGLTCLQRLHSLLLQIPFRLMTIHLQLLEIGVTHLLWTLTSSPELESSVLKELKWDNIVQSLLRVAVIPDAVIIPPRNPYTELFQTSVFVDLLTNAIGCLSCVLEYDAPHIQYNLVANQKFLEQFLGTMQNKTVPFGRRLTAVSVLVDLAYNSDTHAYLCKPHVIQTIIRTWRNVEPTPENNANPAECVYLKYLSAVLMSMLCATRQSFSPQYLQISDLMKQFIDQYNYKELHTHERELGYVWNKYIPFLRVAYLPHYSKRYVQACGSDPRYRNLQMMCMETSVLFFQVTLHRERERDKMVDQGLMNYVICLPSVLPDGSRAQQRAKDLIAMLWKEMHLQPPSLNTMARARLAVTHFGLEKVLNSPAQELLSETYPLC